MDAVIDLFYHLPLGVWAAILLALTVAILFWLRRDMKKQRAWREQKEASIAARKARLAKRERGEP